MKRTLNEIKRNGKVPGPTGMTSNLMRRTYNIGELIKIKNKRNRLASNYWTKGKRKILDVGTWDSTVYPYGLNDCLQSVVLIVPHY